MAEEAKIEELVTPATELPQITAGDLATMVRVIDAVSQRGAFKGEEMETVGALRNKLAVTVQALAPAQEVEETAEETNSETTDETSDDITGDESAA